LLGVDSLQLGERLSAIAGLIQPGAKIVDVGTDHAYLPIYLVEQNRIAAAVAGEVNQGPYLSAQAMLNKLGLQHKISLRFGDGLAVVAPGEVDTAVIAGMGGPTMIEILTKQNEVVKALNYLLLQPMVAAGLVRQWLIENGWRIVDEVLVKDEGRLYEIIAAKQGEAARFEPILYDVGPVLWERRPALLREHLANLLAQTQAILSQMEVSEQAVQSSKYQYYREKLKLLEAKQACL
jgi:tRNA (adenine22-N1)-methyltransferase